MQAPRVLSFGAAATAAALLLAIGPTPAFGDEGGLTTICHAAGKSGQLKTLRLPPKAAAAHLAQHDDYVGTCPTAVGPNGGSISLPGEIAVVIPVGALSASTPLYVKRLSGTPGTMDAVYEIGPDQTHFSLPIEIKLFYRRDLLPADVTEEDLLVADITERLQPLEDIQIDTADRSVAGTSSHLSTYALASLEMTGVNVSDFTTSVSSCRMPVGDLDGADSGGDLSLLSVGTFATVNYPRITFNEAGAPNTWYVATAFNRDQNLKSFSPPSVEQYSARGSFHPGEDWNLLGRDDRGQLVRSIADGIVVLSQSQNSSFGNLLVIAHKLRSGSIIASVYAHLLDPPVLQAGARVGKGQTIGRIGSAPSLSPHLHFEIAQQSLLRVNTRGFIRVPINRTLQRGWYWPGTDTAFIAANYLDPSTFLVSSDCAGAGGGGGGGPSLVTYTFTGVVTEFVGTTEADWRSRGFSVSVGTPFSGRITYDVKTRGTDLGPEPIYRNYVYADAVRVLEIAFAGSPVYRATSERNADHFRYFQSSASGAQELRDVITFAGRGPVGGESYRGVLSLISSVPFLDDYPPLQPSLPALNSFNVSPERALNFRFDDNSAWIRGRLQSIERQ